MCLGGCHIESQPQHQLSWFRVFAVFLFVLDSSFQRTVSSHSFPKHHVPRIPVFISLHFRAPFLPFLHLRPSPQNPTQPTITEISRCPSPTNHTKQSRKYHSLPPPKKITEIFPLTTAAKKPRKYAYFCDFFFLPPSWGTYSAIAPNFFSYSLNSNFQQHGSRRQDHRLLLGQAEEVTFTSCCAYVSSLNIIDHLVNFPNSYLNLLFFK